MQARQAGTNCDETSLFALYHRSIFYYLLCSLKLACIDIYIVIYLFLFQFSFGTKATFIAIVIW